MRDDAEKNEPSASNTSSDSEELLDARAERTTVFLKLELDESARAAHVEFPKRNALRPQVGRPVESVRQATPPPKVAPIEGTLAADLWRSLHDRFKALADEELMLAPQKSGDRWLRAYADYKDKAKECGHWHLSESTHENFRALFEVDATRAGIALGSNMTADSLR